MQYLLTEEELNALHHRKAADDKQTIDLIQDLCTKVADHMPVVVLPGSPSQPWGCIITQKRGLCDECPVKEFCPHPYKRWSK